MGFNRMMRNIAQILILWILCWIIFVIFGLIDENLAESTLVELISSIEPFGSIFSLVNEYCSVSDVKEVVILNFFNYIIGITSKYVIECYIIGSCVHCFKAIQKIIDFDALPILSTFFGVCIGWFILYITQGKDNLQNSVFFYNDLDNILKSAGFSVDRVLLMLILMIIAFILSSFNYTNKSDLIKNFCIDMVSMGFSAIIASFYIAFIGSIRAENIQITIKFILLLISIVLVVLQFLFEKAFHSTN